MRHGNRGFLRFVFVAPPLRSVFPGCHRCNAFFPGHFSASLPVFGINQEPFSAVPRSRRSADGVFPRFFCLLLKNGSLRGLRPTEPKRFSVAKMNRPLDSPPFSAFLVCYCYFLFWILLYHRIVGCQYFFEFNYCDSMNKLQINICIDFIPSQR